MESPLILIANHGRVTVSGLKSTRSIEAIEGVSHKDRIEPLIARPVLKNSLFVAIEILTMKALTTLLLASAALANPAPQGKGKGKGKLGGGGRGGYHELSQGSCKAVTFIFVRGTFEGEPVVRACIRIQQLPTDNRRAPSSVRASLALSGARSQTSRLRASGTELAWPAT
jgi:hypothetical protein